MEASKVVPLTILIPGGGVVAGVHLVAIPYHNIPYHRLTILVPGGGVVAGVHLVAALSLVPRVGVVVVVVVPLL